MSKTTTEKIVQHTHCQICGKAIPMNETLCSEDCKQRYQKMLRTRKWYLYIMYGLIAIVVLIFILGSIR
ncbi:MAG: DUF2116 family Zn-ribbon domain-containing protein [Candidatus Thermoplasmatota archaeon]